MALAERVKELACLSGLGKIVERDYPIERLLAETAKLLSSAFQCPEAACARVMFEGAEFKTKNFKKTKWCMHSVLKTNGVKSGFVEVCYLKKLPGARRFLNPEKELLSLVSERLGRVIDRKRAETKLEERTREYKQLLDSAEVLIQSVDAKGKFLYVNSEWRKTFGYTDKDLKRLTLPDIIRKDHLPHCMGLLKRVTKGITVSGIETVFIAKNGKEIQLRGSARPIMHGGKFISTAGVFINVTERKRAEDALRASEGRFKAFFEGSNDAVFVADTKTHKLVDCNVRAEVFTGYSRKRILSMRADELHPKDMRKETMEGFKRQAEGKQDIVVSEVLTKKGKRIPVEINTAPIEINGKSFMVGVFRDVTERKKAEDVLRASEEKFRVFLDSVPEPVMMLDSKGTVQYLNRKLVEVSGYSNEDLVGKNALTIRALALKSRFTVARHFMGTIAGRTSAPYPIEIVFKDDTHVPMEIHTSVMRKGKKITGVAVLFHDLRPTMAAEKMRKEYAAKLENEVKVRTAELLKAQKVKNEFLSTTTHELKTPLTPIKMQSELWLTGEYGKINKRQRESLEMILGNSKRLMRLIDDVLLMSKIEGANLKYYFADMDLGTVLRESVNESIEAASRKKISLKASFPAGKMVIRGDGMRLKEVFSNLIGNAVKFTPERGRISVESKVSGKNALVSVTDTGIGMSEEYLGRVFEKFQQADQTITRNYGGTGLGLAISHAIIAKHKGRIWVESKVGKGTTVFVMLPLLLGRKRKRKAG